MWPGALSPLVTEKYSLQQEKDGMTAVMLDEDFVVCISLWREETDVQKLYLLSMETGITHTVLG